MPRVFLVDGELTIGERGGILKIIIFRKRNDSTVGNLKPRLFSSFALAAWHEKLKLSLAQGNEAKAFCTASISARLSSGRVGKRI